MLLFQQQALDQVPNFLYQVQAYPANITIKTRFLQYVDEVIALNVRRTHISIIGRKYIPLALTLILISCCESLRVGSFANFIAASAWSIHKSGKESR